MALQEYNISHVFVFSEIKNRRYAIHGRRSTTDVKVYNRKSVMLDRKILGRVLMGYLKYFKCDQIMNRNNSSEKTLQ